MPSSVGLWASSFAEEFLDEAQMIRSSISILDQSPLGSAASYGVPLDLDREFTANQMGFSKKYRKMYYMLIIVEESLRQCF